MSRRLQALPVADFTGGLNLQRDPFQLAPNESPDMLNVEIDPRGGLRSRDGWVRWNNTVVSGTWNPTRMEVMRQPNGTRIVLLANNDKIMHTTTGASWTTLQTGGVDITADGPAGAAFAFWDDKVYLACGRTRTPQRWAGSGGATALTVSGSGGGTAWQNDYASPANNHMPAADLAAIHLTFMFVASTVENGTTHRCRLRWSHPNAVENWNVNDYIDILDGGDAITAIVPFGEQLLIFKTASVWSLRGYDRNNFDLVNVTREVGTESPRTVSRSETAVFFFDWPRGLFRLSGDSLQEVSAPIRPALLDDAVWSDAVAAGDVFVNVINRRCWLSLPFSRVSSPSHVTRSFIYDPFLGPDGAWTVAATADGYGIGPACELVNAAGERRFLGCHPALGYVLQLEVFGEESDTIATSDLTFESFYKTPWINIGVATQRKLWRRPDLIAKRTVLDQVLTVDVFKDYDERAAARQFSVVINANGGGAWDVGADWGVGEWGVVGDSNEIERGGAMGSARAVQLKVTGTPGVRWGLNALVFKVIPRRLR